jgi:hypothetical protein
MSDDFWLGNKEIIGLTLKSVLVEGYFTEGQLKHPLFTWYVWSYRLQTADCLSPFEFYI